MGIQPRPLSLALFTRARPLLPPAIIPRSSIPLLSTELVGLPRKINLSVFSACPVDSSTTPPSIPLSAVKAKIYRYHRLPPLIHTDIASRFTPTKCFLSFTRKLLERYYVQWLTKLIKYIIYDWFERDNQCENDLSVSMYKQINIYDISLLL